MIRKGYILSKQTITQGSTQLVELWVKTESGPVRLHTPTQQPTCFVKTGHEPQLYNIAKSNGIAVTLSNDNLNTLSQEPVTTLKFHSEAELRLLRKAALQHHIPLYEADIQLPDRYLMERFVYGSIAFWDPSESATFVDQAKIKACHYTPSLSAVSIDIECDEHENLFSIAVAGMNKNSVFLRASEDHPATLKPDQEIDGAKFTLVTTHTERELLAQFETHIQLLDPDIIMGWNVKQFDFAVLKRKADALKYPLRIGRNLARLNVREWEGNTRVHVPGRAIVDGIESLKTMTYHYDSFSLDFVSSTLLDDHKLIQDENKLDAIKALYKENPLVLAQYNLKDCLLVNRIEQKTQFIDFLVLRGLLTGLALGRPGGSVAAFLNVYLPKMHRAGYISGNRPDNGGLASPGGYVMRSTPGLYNNVLVLDFKSLYPSIIRTFLIDPVGLAEGLKKTTQSVPGYKGAMFDRHKHFLPEIIENLWLQRDHAKRSKDSSRSQAIKILMNSFYGVLGSGGCPLYDPRLASSITLRGHDIMKETAQLIESQGFDVIYGDTDSTFVHVGNNITHGSAKAAGTFLATHINQHWKDFLKREFGLACHLEIEFEQHFDTFFMPTIRGSSEGSKKRYAGMIKRGKGHELVFKGLENVRSDWTSLAKTFQYTLYEKVFTHQPIESYILETVENLLKGQFDDQLTYARRLRKPIEHYTKTMPPHVRAARDANLQYKTRSSHKRYTKGNTVKYVMTVKGPESVGIASSPLDYDHYVEKQLKPIADSILPLIGSTFSAIIDSQIPLFEPV